ncbi:MAG: DNA mismatch repair protein MutS [Clostridiales bacterium]|nr:DNA mismatch repair protein MutS [Clostridiales bacterium]
MTKILDRSKASPIMRQYLDMKDTYPDCVLFFRLGDFYELFDTDAVEMSKVLDLTLTGKQCGFEERVPMCGIPFHAAENYINKLINLGYKIAICEQVGPIPTKTTEIVKRDVVRVITPGTLVDEGVLDNASYNYIASVYAVDNKIGVAICELSTGEFNIAEFDGGDQFDNLNDFLIRYVPSEIIYCGKHDLEKVLPCRRLNVIPAFTIQGETNYNKYQSEEILSKYFGVNYLRDFDVKGLDVALISAGALLAYLEETQKRSLTHINVILKQKSQNFMHIDINSRRNLEIIETMRDRRKKGALLTVIDKTKTSMGARLIKNWIQQPLYMEKEINSRLDSVEELVKKLILRDKIKNLLTKISDIERICGRVSYGNFSPRDAVSLRNSLMLLPQLSEVLKQFQTEKIKNFCQNMPDLSTITKLLFDAIVDEPPALISAGNYIRVGFNKELDEYRTIKSNNQQTISELENKERELTGLDLKIGFNRVYGYYIEINRQLASRVPLRYVRKQTVANFDRYITDELKEYQSKIENADENAFKLERTLFDKIKDILLENCSKIQYVAQNIAQLDCLLSFAEVAVKNNYVKPKVSSRIDHIFIEEGRHPVVEDINKSAMFIPNDTYLNGTDKQVMIITGPNMAGKSTYMRQVAVITLLAHIGCFVPAKRAEIALTDQIFTRVGASDDLAVGQSTFMVEMMEVANILKYATDKSLIILDEIGRGTSTYDGLSIAWAVVEHIAKNMNTKTMFATHYHELTELEGFLEGVKNFKIAIKEINGQLVFLRKIQRGGANRSYGIEVAELAGVTQSVIERAKVISNELEKNDMSNHIVKAVSNEPEETEKKDKSYLGIVSMLKDIDVNKLTPLSAFEIICDLVQKAKN